MISHKFEGGRDITLSSHDLRIKIKIEITGKNPLVSTLGCLLLAKLDSLIGRLNFAKKRVYIRPEGD